MSKTANQHTTAYIDEATAIQKQLTEYQTNIGHNKHEEGIKNLETALEIDPVHKSFKFKTYLKIAKLNNFLENYEQEIINYDYALRIYQNHYHTIYMRAQTHYNMEKYDECLIDLQHLLKSQNNVNMTEKVITLQKLAEPHKFSFHTYNPMPLEKLHKLLGTNDANTQHEVTKKWRKLLLIFHPDKRGKTTPLEDLRFKFQSIARNNAKEIIIEHLRQNNRP